MKCNLEESFGFGVKIFLNLCRAWWVGYVKFFTNNIMRSLSQKYAFALYADDTQEHTPLLNRVNELKSEITNELIKILPMNFLTLFYLFKWNRMQLSFHDFNLKLNWYYVAKSTNKKGMTFWWRWLASFQSCVLFCFQKFN